MTDVTKEKALNEPLSAAGSVNWIVADAALADREIRALCWFARRDPKVRRPLLFAMVFNVAVGCAVAWFKRDISYAVPIVVVVFSAIVTANYVWWERSIVLRSRRLTRRQSEPGAVLTTEFAAESFTMSTPDISYAFPYASLTHVVQFEDVLVIKPNNHLILALPMELVPPQDLALLRNKVTNRPMRELSLG